MHWDVCNNIYIDSDWLLTGQHIHFIALERKTIAEQTVHEPSSAILVTAYHM